MSGLNTGLTRVGDFVVVGEEQDPARSPFVRDFFEYPGALGLAPLPRYELAYQPLPANRLEQKWTDNARTRREHEWVLRSRRLEADVRGHVG